MEELLRFVCPVQVTKPRYASRDLEFHGRPLRRGDIIIPMLASANADPARFDNPERLDITRSPNPHVAFGTGSHFCLGAQLARVEAQVVIEKLFTRFPNLSLAVPDSALKYTGQARHSGVDGASREHQQGDFPGLTPARSKRKGTSLASVRGLGRASPRCIEAAARPFWAGRAPDRIALIPRNAIAWDSLDASSIPVRPIAPSFRIPQSCRLSLVQSERPIRSKHPLDSFQDKPQSRSINLA